MVVLIDRKEVFREKVGGDADREFVDRGGGAPAGAKLMQRFANIPVQVTAGVHEVVVTFIERSRVATDDLIAGGTQYHGFAFKGYLRLPRLIGSIQVAGPHAATRPHAHTQPGEVVHLQARSPRARTRLRRAHHCEISPGVPSAGPSPRKISTG